MKYVAFLGRVCRSVYGVKEIRLRVPKREREKVAGYIIVPVYRGEWLEEVIKE